MIQRFRPGTHLIALAAAIAIAGCDSSTDPNAGLVEDMAMLDWDGLKGWEVPDSAFVGRAFTITVNTWGDDCVRAGATRIAQTGLRVDLQLTDFHVGDRSTCESFIGPKLHLARLQFDAAGVATVAFRGMRRTTSGEGATYKVVIDTIAIEEAVRIVP